MSLGNSIGYQYTDLQNAAEDRRLVRFVFNTTSPYSLIELQLKVFSRESIKLTHSGTDPSYVALSYEWGPPQPQTEIKINGAPFMIRRNLSDFLRAIQQRYTPRGRRNLVSISHKEYIWSDLVEWLWVDAICINQSNIEERNSQVPQMHHIYDLAWTTLSWLGSPPSCEIAMALQALGDVTERSGVTEDSQDEKRSRDTKIDAILTLAKHTYWTRRWIIQEVLISNGVTFTHGRSELGCSTLVDSVEDLKSQNIPTTTRHTLWSSPLVRLIDLKIGKHTGSRQLYPMSKLLFDFNYANCGVMHDNIYALLELASDLTKFQVDYNCSFESLLCQVLCRSGWEDRGQIRAIVAKIGLTHFLPRTFLDSKQSRLPQMVKSVSEHEEETKFRNVVDIFEVKLPCANLLTGEFLRSQPLMTEIFDIFEFIMSNTEYEVAEDLPFGPFGPRNSHDHYMLLSEMKTHPYWLGASNDRDLFTDLDGGANALSISSKPGITHEKIMKILICDDGTFAFGYNTAQVGDIICDLKFVPTWSLIIRSQHSRNEQQPYLTFPQLIGRAILGGPQDYVFQMLYRMSIWSWSSSRRPIETNITDSGSVKLETYSFHYIDYDIKSDLEEAEKYIWLQFSEELRMAIYGIMEAKARFGLYTYSALSQNRTMRIKYDIWEFLEFAKGYSVEVPHRTVNRI